MNKKDEIGKDIEPAIDLESFKALWKIKSKKVYEQADINFNNFLLYMQCFLEHFYFNHLQLNREQIKEFGLLDECKLVFDNIKMSETLESILYVGANFAFNTQQGFVRQAYNEALELYLKNSKDSDAVKQAVGRRYEGQSEIYAQKILDGVPDEIYLVRINAIVKNFKGFTKKEHKYLKHGLATKKGLDESIVFSIENLHAQYLKEIQKAKENQQ